MTGPDPRAVLSVSGSIGCPAGEPSSASSAELGPAHQGRGAAGAAHADPLPPAARIVAEVGLGPGRPVGPIRRGHRDRGGRLEHLLPRRPADGRGRSGRARGHPPDGRGRSGRARGLSPVGRRRRLGRAAGGPQSREHRGPAGAEIGVGRIASPGRVGPLHPGPLEEERHDRSADAQESHEQKITHGARVCPAFAARPHAWSGKHAGDRRGEPSSVTRLRADRSRTRRVPGRPGAEC